MLNNDKNRQIKLIEGDHNAPRDNLLLAFLKNFLAILLGLGIVTIVFISSANLIIDILPYSLDRSIQTTLKEIDFTKVKAKGNKVEAYLTEIVDKLKRHHEHLKDIDFQLIYDESKDINAYAIPGDKILVTRGLWDTVKSENELAMVLAHELGHFKLRHHLKAYGRVGIVMFLMIPFTGQDLGAELIQMILDNVVSGYQRQQEIAADDFGLFLMQKEYGDQSAGLTSFFEKLTKKENFASKLFSHNSTHPSSQKRLEIIKDKINNLGFKLGTLTPIKNIEKD